MQNESVNEHERACTRSFFLLPIGEYPLQAGLSLPEAGEVEVSVLAPASEECHRWGSPEAEAEMELQVQAFSSARQRGRGAAGRGRGGAAMLARQSLGSNSGAGPAHQRGQTCYPRLSQALAAAHPGRPQFCSWVRPWTV